MQKEEEKEEEEEACRKVRVAINIDHIFSIDVQKQTWTVAFTAIYEWNDPELEEYEDEEVVDWSKHFVPNVQFEGAHDLYTESEILPRIHDTKTNTAKLTLKYKGEFTATVKLQHYPFDVHLFVLHLKPRKHGKASDPDHLRVVKLVNFGTDIKGSANRTHKLNKDGLATVPNFDVLMSPDAGKERVGKNGSDCKCVSNSLVLLTHSLTHSTPTLNRSSSCTHREKICTYYSKHCPFCDDDSNSQFYCILA
jgi:hypothetical protein